MEKFREAKSASGPDVAVVIGSEHVNVERGQAVRRAIVSDVRFSIDEAQATETKSIGIMKPDFIAR